MSTCTDVRWRYALLDEWAGEAAPRSLDVWLDASERRYWDALPQGPGRASWMAGRRLIKTIVADQLRRVFGATADPARDIQVHSLNRWGRKSAPQVVWRGRELPWSLSVSHTERGVLAAVVTAPGRRVGVDLVDPAASRRRLPDLWFTPEERCVWDLACSETRMRLWAIKEAIYKACSRGERFTPQHIAVLRGASGELGCRYAGCAVRLESLGSFRVDGQWAVIAVVPRDGGERAAEMAAGIPYGMGAPEQQLDATPGISVGACR